ncbi:hypothetical protein [Blastopirellula marina]|uniref:hypothetical protein n=1 Tax=Blastopirellula marina TaxID=124 RepID=UPI0013048BF1|nr:hypothetical protein [Blastopirellula marina]
MKASWRHLGLMLIATQAVGCFGVRYRDSMELPTCGPAACQNDGDGSAVGGLGHHHGQREEAELIAYDQPMIPPRAKFHPVPTQPVFAPRVQYSPPQLIRTPVLAEAPQGPILMEPSPELKPVPIETPAPIPMPTAPSMKPLPTEVKTPQPLPPPTVHAKPIIAPLPQPINLDQPLEIAPIRGVWRTKSSS